MYEQIRNASITHHDGRMSSAIDEFDLSGYDSKRPIFNGLDLEEIKKLKLNNEKIPGVMKDELDGNTLIEFIGLRAKAYAFKQIVEYENDNKD